MISDRAKQWQSHDPFLVKAHFACADDPFDPGTNPDGYVNFGTAENKMVFDVLKPLLQKHIRIKEPDTHYNQLHGAQFFREAIAEFLGRRAGRNLSPNNITVASGASAILEMLSFAVCDPGDAILIPTPYYSGFDHDLALRSAARLIPVSLAGPDFTLSISAITRSLHESRAEGGSVRTLLINSPQNPLGYIVDDDLLNELIALADSENIHLIIDEIYAESLLPGNTLNSVLSHKNAVYSMVYGFAKDFGLSGYKVGIHYSEDEDIVQTMQNTSYFHTVSMETQRTLTGVLNDPGLEVFLDTMRLRLSKRYRTTVEILTSCGVPHTTVQGGIVLWLDLRRLLQSPTFDAERNLYRNILSTCRVNISPGQAFHCVEPGWFRLCFTMPEKIHNEGMRRLTGYFADI